MSLEKMLHRAGFADTFVARPIFGIVVNLLIVVAGLAADLVARRPDYRGQRHISCGRTGKLSQIGAGHTRVYDVPCSVGQWRATCAEGKPIKSQVCPGP